MKGTLYVCSTPIGNLEDASFRLVRILSEVDLIACEDTRHTRVLLNHFNINKPTISYHEHNSKEREETLVSRLNQGQSIALVSDAGTPGISDPGYPLIHRAAQEGIRIEVIPGPSALIAALVVSGLDTDRFVFEGFLPARASQRVKRLEEIIQEQRTIILYEAPHRLLKLLEDINNIMGDRQVAVIRELTKIHEETRRGSLADLIKHFEEHPPRGEITVIVEGNKQKPKNADLSTIVQEVKDLVAGGMEKKEALKLKAQEYKVKKGELYMKFVELTHK
ncbi:MAG: 16S rRNA (cytidine(1402)-2'-O)-methyltransferase [Chitinophagales bacterium]